MWYILNLILISYSFFYQYETPTYPGFSSLYAQNIWYFPSAITQNRYQNSITISGILPYSYSDLKHSSLSISYKIKKTYFFSGIKFRKLLDVYTESTFLLGGGVKVSGIGITSNIRIISERLKNNNSLLKPTLDFSFAFKHKTLVAGYTIFNLLKPNLTFNSNTKSKIAHRGLISLNYPSSVFFTLGYEKNKDYETPFLSTEVWFTHGFNVTFGIQNNTVEGSIGLRSNNLGIGVKIKSHTIMGPTYSTFLSFYRE